MIILVDDAPVMLKLYTMRLRGLGLPIVATSTIEAAFEAIEVQHPRLVVTDWIMPGLDGPVGGGAQFIRGLRNFGYDGPILVVWSATELAAHRAAIDAGATARISKGDHDGLCYMAKQVLGITLRGDVAE